MPISVGLKPMNNHFMLTIMGTHVRGEKGTFLYKQMIQRGWVVLQSDGVIKAVLWDYAKSDTVSLEDSEKSNYFPTSTSIQT